MTEFLDILREEFALPFQDPVLVFALILSIILLAPILLRRTNIPSIIALIISGIIIGPHGLKLLENDSAIGLFSTIGILYIMFLAGLDLDLNEFKANRNKSILFGIFTFIIPLGIGYPAMYYILGYDFNASFLTASMFATHTLVAYPIVSKLGVSKNQAVAITVGGTILTDTAVMIVLAIIVGNAQGGLTQEFWIRLAVGVGIFAAIMFLLIPRITKVFFEKLESEKYSHYIFVLCVVFIAAFLSKIVGLESIIGAFAAGLALNKHIPASSALMNRIEYIGNSLFIPFFLISVGMLVDVSVLLSGYMAWVIAAVLTIVAIFGKWLAAFFTQIVFKYTKAQRNVIFGLSGAHAAATLAVIIVGHNYGIIDDNILNGTIILILITSIVASVYTQKAAKEIVIQSEDEDTLVITESDEEIHDEHILLPIANISNIERLLEFSVFIKDKESVNPISILSVVSNNDEAEKNIMKARKELERFVAQGSATETNVKVITTIDYNPVQGISRIAKEILADFIVLGWPRQASFIDTLVGEKINRIVDSNDKTIFLCQLEKQIILHKSITVAAPPYAEYEGGFEGWVHKIGLLAQELTIPLNFFCTEATMNAVNKVLKEYKMSCKTNHKEFEDWDDFLILARYIESEDLLVFVSARKGSTSYLNVLHNIPDKLEKYFAKNNKIVIYPQQKKEDYKSLASGEVQLS